MYTLFVLLPAFALTLFTLLMWVEYNRLEMWVANNQLHYKGTLSLFKPKGISFNKIKNVSIEVRDRDVWVILNLHNGKGILHNGKGVLLNGKGILIITYESSSRSKGNAIEVRDAINHALLAHSALHRGQRYLANGNFQKAIDEFNQAIVTNQNDAFLFFFRSLAKEFAKDYKNALLDLNQAIRMTPNDGLLYMHRTTLHYQLEMWEEAWRDLEKLVKLKPAFASHKDVLTYKKLLAQKTGRG